jgi:hypothetical protein
MTEPPPTDTYPSKRPPLAKSAALRNDASVGSTCTSLYTSTSTPAARIDFRATDTGSSSTSVASVKSATRLHDSAFRCSPASPSTPGPKAMADGSTENTDSLPGVSA